MSKVLVTIDAVGLPGRDNLAIRCIKNIKHILQNNPCEPVYYLNWIKHEQTENMAASYELTKLCDIVSNHEQLWHYGGDILSARTGVDYALNNNINYVVKTCGDCIWSADLTKLLIDTLLTSDIELVYSRNWYGGGGNNPKFVSTQIYSGKTITLKNCIPPYITTANEWISNGYEGLILEGLFNDLIKSSNCKALCKDMITMYTHLPNA